MKKNFLLFFLLIFSFASYAYEPFSGETSPFEKSTLETANEIMSMNSHVSGSTQHYRNGPNDRDTRVGNWIFQKKSPNPRRSSGIFPNEDQGNQRYSSHVNKNYDSYQNNMGSYYGLQRGKKDNDQGENNDDQGHDHDGHHGHHGDHGCGTVPIKGDFILILFAFLYLIVKIGYKKNTITSRIKWHIIRDSFIKQSWWFHRGFFYSFCVFPLAILLHFLILSIIA